MTINNKQNTMTFQHIQPTEEKIRLMEEFRRKFESLASEIKLTVIESRERSLAITKLEEASFWLNKGITHNE